MKPKVTKGDAPQVIDLGAMGGSYLDYENREILLLGEIDASAVERYIMPIISMNKDDDVSDMPINERKPITIYIACDGGDVNYGLALADIIMASKTPIIGIVISHAYSMGCIVYLACHYRYCYKNSSFLIHDGVIGIESSGSKFRDMSNFIKSQEVSINDFICNRTKISEKLLQKKSYVEWYMTSTEAVEHGLVEKVISRII